MPSTGRLSAALPRARADRLDSAMLSTMKTFDLASFDVASFDPCARRPRRRPLAARPAAHPEPEPARAPVVGPQEVARLGDAVASLTRQLGEVQAVNAALAQRLDNHIEEPRREAEAKARLQHFYASRFKSPVG